MVTLSVIIPTYNRTHLLLRVTESLLNQWSDVEGGGEIVVVDDGSTEDVQESLAPFLNDSVRYFRQRRSGPAAARNLGINKARGKVILFLGDDIVPLPGLLRVHVEAHLVEHPEEEIAILGMADLPPEYQSTPFVQWWRRWNFRYWMLLEGKRQPDFSFFYTNNLSLKRSFLIKSKMFDEAFRYAAYEDGELGARLTERGMRLIFKPDARAYHYHPVNLANACQRMITKGKAYDLFVRRTGLRGMSQWWMLFRRGPWMHPAVMTLLFRIANWSQTRGVVGVLYIVVLTYYFEVGRGNRRPLNVP